MFGYPVHPIFGYPVDDQGEPYTDPATQVRRKVCQERVPEAAPGEWWASTEQVFLME